MAPFGTGAQALIEIIHLCEQTLTALYQDASEGRADENTGQYRRPEYDPRSKLARRLFLIKGGRSTANAKNKAW